MATKKKLLQAAAGQAGGAGLNVEEVFSTYLYDGTGANQTITNGIDLSGEGGLVWIKSRSNAYSNYIYDTERGTSGGAGYHLATNSNIASTLGSVGKDLYQFNSDGFELGPNFNAGINNSGYEQASWTFRKAPKFFDVVTYTGDSVAGREIAHNLGQQAGFVVIKCTSTSQSWLAWHHTMADNTYLVLNGTSGVSSGSGFFQTANDTMFQIGNYFAVNASGETYVAYLFAHNDGDGEFGPTGDQDIIKCGSYTGNGSTTGPVIDLGFEPQWLLLKNAGNSGGWYLFDAMRGLTTSSINDAFLQPDSSVQEDASKSLVNILPNGFQLNTTETELNASSTTYIYMAIRRGPMAVPESATDVFAIDTANASLPTHQSGFVTDTVLRRINKNTTNNFDMTSRLTQGARMYTALTNAESAISTYNFDYMNGAYDIAGLDTQDIAYMWRRAPNYFDVVAYTGNGVAGRTVSHNLGVAPEMMWVKQRNTTGDWGVYHKDIGNDKVLILNANIAETSLSTAWNNTTPTDASFTVGTWVRSNGSGSNIIAYLFASLDGVSKVFSVTKSSGSDASVNCGFSAGPRFVLLKRTDSTGDWYVWDSERGIVAGNDPYLLLNSTAAEVTSTDYIDPTSNGFTIVNGGLTDGDYIGYAVA